MPKQTFVPGDAALRRQAYGEYAKATVCFELGVTGEAVTRAREALRLYAALRSPNEEDQLVRRELENLIKRQ